MGDHMRDILAECVRLRKTIIQPLNDKYHGPLDKTTMKNTSFPFVLLLGNHSSGKSSFVNWILKRDVQVSGVAPTDDSFTIIGPAAEDIDRAGPALLGDPDLGFSGLRHFGPMLAHRTQLKLRSGLAAQNFMIVDTPGMIDSPVGLWAGSSSASSSTSASSASAAAGSEATPAAEAAGLLKQERERDRRLMDRGYDFEGVCRWYAERADVILLFFDPDKPGTTGETLQVLTNSLVGLDHKLHIILNKADQFRKIHDFARAYGSLCWNLSKVIQRKDLPQIHTMCLPQKPPPTPLRDGDTFPLPLFDLMANLGPATFGLPSLSAAPPSAPSSSSSSSSSSAATAASSSSSSSAATGMLSPVPAAGPGAEGCLPLGLLDLDAARRLVEKECFNAPKRRVDNEITRVGDSVNALLMHLRVVDDVVARYREAVWRRRLSMLGCGMAWGCLGLVAAGLAPILGAEAPAASTSSSSSSISISGGGGGGGKTPSPGAVRAALTASVASLAGLSTAALHWWQQRSLSRLSVELLGPASLQATFGRLYSRQIQQRDAFTLALWQSVCERLTHGVQGPDLGSLPRVKAADVQALERLLEADVGDMRRKAFSDAFSATPARDGKDGRERVPASAGRPGAWAGGGSSGSSGSNNISSSSSNSNSSSVSSSSSSGGGGGGTPPHSPRAPLLLTPTPSKPRRAAAALEEGAEESEEEGGAAREGGEAGGGAGSSGKGGPSPVT